MLTAQERRVPGCTTQAMFISIATDIVITYVINWVFIRLLTNNGVLRNSMMSCQRCVDFLKIPEPVVNTRFNGATIQPSQFVGDFGTAVAAEMETVFKQNSSACLAV